MEAGSCSCSEKRLWALSVMEAFMIEAVVHVYESLTCLVLLTGQLLNDIDGLPKLKLIDESFSLDELHKRECPESDIKDASETEEDDDEDEDNADEQDDDEDDEDFSGEEEGEEGDPEDDPEANGDGGSEDDDEDDDGDEDDADEDEDEDEEEDEEDEEDAQPPSKKRK
ncbi:glutamic acid-rich protein-like [Mangifera indica]|uniref:glutamic acid-rich protein-like n=1 Tax=Mangifera indica TaxID=29780 RepID=UPI001CF9FA83|nr:glutamic acid-rich protein-like [Mangifera indica]XP_044471066.1 glutamic acid-rich protein-like [Mangifera indica]